MGSMGVALLLDPASSGLSGNSSFWLLNFSSQGPFTRFLSRLLAMLGFSSAAGDQIINNTSPLCDN